jgi:hypothetical protein
MQQKNRRLEVHLSVIFPNQSKLRYSIGGNVRWRKEEGRL